MAATGHGFPSYPARTPHPTSRSRLPGKLTHRNRFSRALPRVARLICSWSVDIRYPLGRVRSSSFNTKLLPRFSSGVIAQVMWNRHRVRHRFQTPCSHHPYAGQAFFAGILLAVSISRRRPCQTRLCNRRSGPGRHEPLRSPHRTGACPSRLR